MDTLNHFTTSFTETVIPLTALNVPQVITIPCGIVAGLLGASPDIIGEFYAHVLKDEYKMYNKIHNGEHWLSYIPYVKQHTFFDKFVHGIGKRWYMNKWWEYFIPSRWVERSWVESLFWVINIILITIYIILI